MNFNELFERVKCCFASSATLLNPGGSQVNKPSKGIKELSKSICSMDSFLWLAYNVGFGALPIWLAFLIHSLATNSPSPDEKFLKGELLVFITTLCATCMPIVGEFTEKKFWNLRRFLLFVLVAVVVVSSSIWALVSSPQSEAALGFSEIGVRVFSWIMFGIGVLTCLMLFAMQKTMSYQEEQEKDITTLTKDAKDHTRAPNGPKL